MSVEKEYSIHPYCAAFPDLPADELKELADNIDRYGQQQPIYRWNKQILDGKNRLKACGLAGVVPIIEAWYPKHPEDQQASDDEAWEFCRSMNLHRRHLTASQRAMIAASRCGATVGRPNSANLQNYSIEQAAEEMNVSPRTIATAKNVLTDGSAALKDAVKNGEVTLNDAAHVIDLPKADQTAAVKSVQSGNASTVTEAAKPKRERKAKSEPKEREPGDESESEAEPSDWMQHVPKHLHPIAGSLREFRSAINAIGKLRNQIQAICEAPGGGKLSKVWSDMERMCEQLAVNLKAYRFWSACPECKITDKHQKADPNCKMCRSHGWIAKTNGLSDIHKTWLKEHGVDV